MSLQDQLDALLDATVIDSAGVKVGKVERIYLDDVTGKATFATVSTGIFSADSTLPLYGAQLLEGELHVDHTKQKIKSAPHMKEIEDGLSPDVEADLCDYFGIDLPVSKSAPAEAPTSAPGPAPAAADEPTGAADTGTTDSDDVAPENETNADTDTDEESGAGTDEESDAAADDAADADPQTHADSTDSDEATGDESDRSPRD